MSRLTRNQEKFWGKGNYKGEKYIIGSDGVTSKQMCLNKLGKLEDLEEQLGCSLEVILKLVDQNELYYQFFDELQHWTSIKIDLRKKVVWYCKQVGGHYACSQPLSNYGKTFWLKKDKSE